MTLEVQGHGAQLELLRTLKAHALLFAGQDGVGRRKAARWYAQFLNCQRFPDGPCGGCESCRLLERDQHPDYREVGPQAVTTTGRASRRPEIRIAQLVPREGEDPDDSLTRWLESRPRFKARVGVIDGAETLNANAGNAFLKMLEEPPSYARIILVAPSPQAVLPTLASRCTVLRFGSVRTASALANEHPSERLGRPGDLYAASAQPEAFRDLLELVDAYLHALDKGLEQALEAADALEKRWLEDSPFHPDELLLARLSGWPPAHYAAASDALARFQDALAAYAPAGLAMQVLTLELREILGRSGS